MNAGKLKPTASSKILKVLSGATESSQHSFDDEEKAQFVVYINQTLANEESIKRRIPINPNGSDIFEQTKDGIILSKLINKVCPETIDERVLNDKNNLNRFEMIENNNIVINSARAIGCNIINIDTNDIMEGKEHLVLGILWQIIKKGLLAKIDLKYHPELTRLLNKDESVEDILKLSPDVLLLRWFNYHLENSKCERRVTNFSKDIKDSICYIYLLNQLDPVNCDLQELSEQEEERRAEKMLKNAEKIGCRRYNTPRAIVEGNPRLNLAFIANLFNQYPGLKPLTKEEEKNIDDSLFSHKKSREERVFSLWLFSIMHETITDLSEDLCDGLVLLKALDVVSPKTVLWSKVNKEKPMSRFKALENTNYVVEICKNKGMSLIGTQGADVTDKNKKLVLGLVWQIMKMHVFLTLSKISNKKNKEANEKDLIDLANEIVSKNNKKERIKTFKDKELQTSLFFIDLIDSIRPGIVDYKLVFEGKTEDELNQNGKYSISLARKIGAVLFLLPEDIIQIKPKMILIFVASLLEVKIKEEDNKK